MTNATGPFPTLLAAPLSGSHAANRLGGKIGAGMDRSAVPSPVGAATPTTTLALSRR